MSFNFRNPKLKIARRLKAKMLLSQFFDHEMNLKFLRYVIRSSETTKQTKVLAIFYMTTLDNYISHTKHKNICLLSGQHRGVNVKFKMHRGMLRYESSNLNVPGISVAS